MRIRSPATAERAGFPLDRLILGGDHLGPFPWQGEPAATLAARGAPPVRTFTYGAGDDRRPEYGERAVVQTGRVDLSGVVPGGWTEARTASWGFDPTRLPLNARVWIPDGASGAPLVLLVLVLILIARLGEADAAGDADGDEGQQSERDRDHHARGAGQRAAGERRRVARRLVGEADLREHRRGAAVRLGGTHPQHRARTRHHRPRVRLRRPDASELAHGGGRTARRWSSGPEAF